MSIAKKAYINKQKHFCSWLVTEWLTQKVYEDCDFEGGVGMYFGRQVQILYGNLLFFLNKTGLKQGDPLSPILFNLAFRKVIQSIKMVPSGIKIGKEQLNILANADDIALIVKNEIETRKLFVEMENIARKFGLQINQEKTKHMIVERENCLKKNKIGHLKIKITNL